MKELKEVFEYISKGEMTISDINKELLIMYGIKERYFFHFGYYTDSLHKHYVNTEELIEVEESFYYDTLLPMEDKIVAEIDKGWYKPIKYMSDEIPQSKKVKSILYK